MVLGIFGKFSSSLYGNISACVSKDDLGRLAGVRSKSERSALGCIRAIGLGMGEYLSLWTLWQVLEG